MTAKTHLAGGLVAGIAYCGAFSTGLIPVEEPDILGYPICLGLSLLGSIMPDIDLPTSKAAQAASLPARIINIFFGHRTLTHSPFIVILMFLAFRTYIPQYMVLVLAFLVGWSSHILLDALNKAGVPLFYPYTKRFHLMSIRIRSAGERALFVFLLVLSGAVAAFFAAVKIGLIPI